MAEPVRTQMVVSPVHVPVDTAVTPVILVGFWIAEKSGGLEVFYIFIFLVHLFLFFLTFDKDNAKQNYIELKSSPCYRKYPEKIRFESVLSISLSCLSVCARNTEHNF